MSRVSISGKKLCRKVTLHGLLRDVAVVLRRLLAAAHSGLRCSLRRTIDMTRKETIEIVK